VGKKDLETDLRQQRIDRGEYHIGRLQIRNLKAAQTAGVERKGRKESDTIRVGKAAGKRGMGRAR